MGPFNTADITMVLRVSGVRCETGFSLVVAPTVPNLAALAQRAYVSMGKALEDSLSFVTSFEEAIARWDGREGRYSGNRVGKAASPGVPVSSSLLVSKIPVQGRQGRMYIPGVAESVVNAAGLIDQSILANLQSAADDFLVELDSVNCQMVMRRPDGSSDAVDRLLVKPYVGRQDRRLVRAR